MPAGRQDDHRRTQQAAADQRADGQQARRGDARIESDGLSDPKRHLRPIRPGLRSVEGIRLGHAAL
jgi:hypothetical protein